MLHRMFRIGMRRRELVLHGDQAAADNAARKIDLLVIHTGDARIFDHASSSSCFNARIGLRKAPRDRGHANTTGRAYRRPSATRTLGVTNHGFGARVGNPTVAAASACKRWLCGRLSSAPTAYVPSVAATLASTAISGLVATSTASRGPFHEASASRTNFSP